MSTLLGKYYDEDVTKLFELVINKLLKNKYKWFDRIIVNKLSFSKTQNYMGIDADLFADKDWVNNQWRKFYTKPIPSGTEEDPIVLSEFIDEKLSYELQDDLKNAFLFVTSEQRPKYMSYSWIEVIPTEMNNKNLQENIQRIREMMNLNEKLEDIQGTPLYHKTSTNRGLDIINSDSLRGVWGVLSAAEYKKI